MKWPGAIVFNNPFDSFHNIVAEAKEEREQLDRLLTISTPRERLLVAVIAVLFFLLAAWLFLGDVARTVAVDGIVIQPGEHQPEGKQPVQALVWVERDVARQIKAGMPAAIALSLTNGAADTLDGKVEKIAAVPLSEALAPYEPSAPVSVYRVAIALDRSADLAAFAGRNCRIVIELGRQSPAALLSTRRL